MADKLYSARFEWCSSHILFQAVWLSVFKIEYSGHLIMGNLVRSRVVSWFQGLQGAQQIFLAPDVFELDSKFVILCNGPFLKDNFCLLHLGLYFSKSGLGWVDLTQLCEFPNEISEQSNITIWIKRKYEKLARTNFQAKYIWTRKRRRINTLGNTLDFHSIAWQHIMSKEFYPNILPMTTF